jgi:hypothetical protein
MVFVILHKMVSSPSLHLLPALGTMNTAANVVGSECQSAIKKLDILNSFNRKKAL